MDRTYKEKNKQYDVSKIRKIFQTVLLILGILLITVICIGICALVEWLFPNLFDIVRFD